MITQNKPANNFMEELERAYLEGGKTAVADLIRRRMKEQEVDALMDKQVPQAKQLD